MKSRNRWHSLLALIVMSCMLALPTAAFAKKGRDHYNRGMDYEKAQQWEKAAQEFTLALAADPANIDYQLHYRRAIFNASQSFMQQGRALAEQRDYVGAYNAFRQAFGYDPVNQLAVSEMERMLRLEQVKQGTARTDSGDGNPKTDSSTNDGTPSQPGQARTPEQQDFTPKPEVTRVINFNGVDLKTVIKQLAGELNLNVMFDRQSFAQPRPIEVNLRDVTAAKALDYIFLQENLFFQKLDRRTILVADQTRRPQYQQLVVRTFFIANSDPDKVKGLIAQALPASVGRPQPIVVSDKDTNSLTVRDTAENVKLIGDLLQSIDKDRAEVVMDVEIYEVNRSDLLQFGNQIGSTGGFNLGGSPGVSILTSNSTTNPNQTPGVDIRSIVAAIPTGAAAALVIPPAVFNAFQSRNNAKLLASTQIHAFNNEESSARIGQRVPVQTAQAYPFGVQTGTNTTNPNGFPTGGFPVINYEPTGLTLNFTPIVFPNLDVQVKMKIETKDVSGANTLTPTFTERTLNGTARVQNNRTMMLASVSTEVQSNGRQGLPVLGGLPIIGRLFTSPTKENRQVDIVIAVTPRVLRAPSLTPRDEEMRPSGTLQAPTTGSLEAMLRETEREEQIAAARRLPKQVNIQLPDASPVTYEPGKTDQVAVTAQNQTATTNQTSAAGNGTQSGNAATAPTQTAPAPTASSQNQTAITNQASTVNSPPAGNGGQNGNAVTAPTLTAPAQSASSTRTDVNLKNDAVPQPKSASLTSPQSPATEQKTDVATAVKSLVSSPSDVSTASLNAKQDVAVTTPTEQPVAKNDSTVPAPRAIEPVPGLIELSLTPGQNELKLGEKRQLALQVKSGTPLGLAVVTLRFDPTLLKVSAISAGSIFANAKSAPSLTQSIDPEGLVLLSLTPAANSPVAADGTLLNIDVEAIGAGDSALTFDIANTHLLARDGRATTLQIEQSHVNVKPAGGSAETPAPKAAPTETSSLPPPPKMEKATNADTTSQAAAAPKNEAAKATYVVKTGDTLEKIAAALRTSVNQLIAANPKLGSGELPPVGTELLIP
ncbi:MAG TPA: LysM peptidoglycan-binding domain-containing protein [Pyrinomonadaceae bacterium]|nr:LysM peptidoglycan-binding domain-containing protein [Pyrinomonadaceae bacterium]